MELAIFRIAFTIALWQLKNGTLANVRVVEKGQNQHFCTILITPQAFSRPPFCSKTLRLFATS